MKHKKIISTLLFILCFQFILGFFVVQVGAADAVAEAPGIDFVPSVAIPGASFLKGDCVEPENIGKPCMRILGSFEATKGVISGMYKFGLGIAGILATIMIAFGGITWLSSGGNASQIQRAKQYITGALTGLVLGLLSYTMLYIVNPDIVNLEVGDGVTMLSPVAEGCSFVKSGTCTKDAKYELSVDTTKCGGYPGKGGDGEWECCCLKRVSNTCGLSIKDIKTSERLGCGRVDFDNACIGVYCDGDGLCKITKDDNDALISGVCLEVTTDLFFPQSKGSPLGFRLIDVPTCGTLEKIKNDNSSVIGQLKTSCSGDTECVLIGETPMITTFSGELLNLEPWISCK